MVSCCSVVGVQDGVDGLAIEVVASRDRLGVGRVGDAEAIEAESTFSESPEAPCFFPPRPLFFPPLLLFFPSPLLFFPPVTLLSSPPPLVPPFPSALAPLPPLPLLQSLLSTEFG